jgi:hypothetical protein
MHRASALSRLALRAAVLSAAAVALCGCPDDDDLDIDYAVPTSIVIDPVAFLRGVPCSDAPGAMRSYVATVTDRTDIDPKEPGTQTFTLPSSDPAPCSERAQFRRVVPGHTYTAEIDGYELPADQLVPVGGESSGSRDVGVWEPVEQPGSADPVLLFSSTVFSKITPRWRFSCGERTVLEGAALALETCELLEDRGTTAVTAIRVDPTAALGDLRCASQGGQIESFDVLPAGGGLPAVLGMACPPAEPVIYNVGIAPGQLYQFRIEATGAGSTYGATCQAVAVDRVTVPGACSPLSNQGALRIPIGPVLKDAGLACGPDDPDDANDLTAYVARLESTASPPALDPIQSSAVPCAEDARFSLLPPGPYQAVLRDAKADQGSPPIATCTGDVLPGATTVAACSIGP